MTLTQQKVLEYLTAIPFAAFKGWLGPYALYSGGVLFNPLITVAYNDIVYLVGVGAIENKNPTPRDRRSYEVTAKGKELAAQKEITE